MSAGRDGLPSGWLTTQLGQVAEVSSGYGFPEDLQGRQDQAIPFAKVGDISRAVAAGGRLSGAPHTISFDDLRRLRARTLPPGTTVFAKIGEAIRLNRRAITTCELVVDNNVMAATPIAGCVEPEFIRRWMQTVDLYPLAGATTVPSVRKSVVIELEFPLPPLNEQKRIVAKIEALQLRSSAAKEALDAIGPLLEKFRQSVLAAAFRGDLTRKWREAHPNTEPASKLLERIRAERRRRWEATNPKKKYVEPEPVDTTGLPELPEGWCWASLEELASDFNYGTAEKSATEGRVPVLRMGNLQGGEIDWTDLKYTDDTEEIEKYGLAPNTVLFNRTNSPELVGKTSIYRGERPAVFAGYLIRVVLLDAVVPDFVNLNLNSPWGRDWCWSVKSDGVSQSNISAGKLKTYPIPLCPAGEQQQLVRLVRAQLELADRVGDLGAQSQVQVAMVNQSILAKAFRGELVPQDPNDEPASKLLDRIRQEREAGGDKPSRRRRA